MTSPVDTLKALVVEMRETERELRVEDRSVGIWPDNDTADIVKEWRERTDAAIAALSGGEAEPVAWRIQWSETIPGDYELTYSRKRVEGAAALANPPRIEPLYTTPRIPDGIDGQVIALLALADDLRNGGLSEEPTNEFLRGLRAGKRHAADMIESLASRRVTGEDSNHA